jgi:hypothetical protein
MIVYVEASCSHSGDYCLRSIGLDEVTTINNLEPAFRR